MCLYYPCIDTLINTTKSLVVAVWKLLIKLLQISLHHVVLIVAIDHFSKTFVLEM